MQYVLPKKIITKLAGKIAMSSYGSLTTLLIKRFIERYDVDMHEALFSQASDYATFNDFFTRALKPGLRPLAKAPLICPVDGAVSQWGRIEKDQIFQAKGHVYGSKALLAEDVPGATVESVNALLSGDNNAKTIKNVEKPDQRTHKSLQNAVCSDLLKAQQFDDGYFATLYLSPRDYHRIHMPCDGTLMRMTYVPGDLFSVNPVTAANVSGLFARNERVVCWFLNKHGMPFVMVLVGAAVVGSVATVWHGVVNPPRLSHVQHWDYSGQAHIKLKQGQEMGRFLLGSTVVMLFPKRKTHDEKANAWHFNPAWSEGLRVKMGQVMASGSV